MSYLQDPIAKRSVTFNDLTPQIRINEISTYIIDVIPSRSRRGCVIRCLKNPECKSYSFCKRYCELYVIGVTELRRNERHYFLFTVADENCDLFSMQKDFTPQCEEFGSIRSIRNDSNPNYCKINQKRADGLFLEREYFNSSIDEALEYKGFTKRRCVPETALNGGYCKAEYETKAVWVKWRSGGGKRYSADKKYCEDVGGMIYPDLDGDAEQVEFLKKYKAKTWLGLTVDSKWYLFKNLRGEQMRPDRIRWWNFEWISGGKYVGTDAIESSAVIKTKFNLARAVCQMLV